MEETVLTNANDMPATVVLTAAANKGIGFWTSICCAFAGIFGCESRHYKEKCNAVISAVRYSITAQAKRYPNYVITDFRIVKEGNIAYVASAVLVKRG